MRFVEATKEDLPQIYEQMLVNFIPDELRDYDDVVRLFGHNYTIEHIVCDGVRTGFMGTWRVGDYMFLEHFVIYEQFRNRGIGGKALECMQEKAGRLLLETELPNEPMAARRIGFYLRHRMVLNPQQYFQPPYRPTGNACPLKLMSYPEALSDFDGVASTIYETVYGIEYEKRKYF